MNISQLPDDIFAECVSNSPKFRKFVMDAVCAGSSSVVVKADVETIVRAACNNKIAAIKAIREYSTGKVDFIRQAFPTIDIQRPDSIGSRLGLAEAKQLVEFVPNNF